MSFLRPDFSRPGRGVEKDEQVSPVAKFFLVFFRRLSKFIQLNLTFLIPVAVILAMVVGLLLMPVQRYGLEIRLPSTILQLSLWELYVVPLPLILLAPFHTGLMVVTKRLANEEYAFVWSEYWEGVRDNWKQGLLNGILCYVAYVVLSFSLVYYFNTMSDGALNFIPLAFSLLMLVIFLLAELYIPTMMVSVKLKFIPLVKNSIIFGFMNFFKNLLTIAMLLVVCAVLYCMQLTGITLLIGLFFVVSLFFSVTAYIATYMAYPMIDSYIIKPYQKKEEVANAPEVQRTTSDFEYEHDELDDDDDKPEYVYYNGKLVKRDELKK